MAQLAFDFKLTGFDNPYIDGRKSLVTVAKQEIQDEMRRQANIILTGRGTGGGASPPSLRSTVDTWDSPKPRFTVERVVRGGDLTMKINVSGPKAQRWLWINEGTGNKGKIGSQNDGYTISAKSKPRLALPAERIPQSKRAKTLPKVLSSYKGETSYQSAARVGVRQPKQVTHFGIEPRLWTEEIRRRREKFFVTAMQKTLDRTADRVNRSK